MRYSKTNFPEPGTVVYASKVPNSVTGTILVTRGIVNTITISSIGIIVTLKDRGEQFDVNDTFDTLDDAIENCRKAVDQN